MRRHNCQDCTSLWSEYALANRHFLKSEARLEHAKLSRDPRFGEIRAAFERAAEERAELRRRIDFHEAMHMGVATATA
jgi:hypothetical protein